MRGNRDRRTAMHYPDEDLVRETPWPITEGHQRRRRAARQGSLIAEYVLSRAVLAVSALTSRSAGSVLSSQETGTSWAVCALKDWARDFDLNGWGCGCCGSGAWWCLSTP